MVCSSRGRRRGTITAGLSKVRISQNVLYPPMATTPAARAIRFSNRASKVIASTRSSLAMRNAELLPGAVPA